MLHQFHHQILVSPNGRQWRSCVSSEQNNKLQLQKNVRTPVSLCTKSAQALYRGRRGEEMGHRREGKLIMDVQPSTRAQCWPSVFVQLYNQMSEWGRPRRTSGFCKDSHTLPSTDSTVMTCSSVMWLPSTAFTVTATGGTSPRQRILGISRSYPCNSPNQSVIWLT